MITEAVVTFVVGMETNVRPVCIFITIVPSVLFVLCFCCVMGLLVCRLCGLITRGMSCPTESCQALLDFHAYRSFVCFFVPLCFRASVPLCLCATVFMNRCRHRGSLLYVWLS